MAQLKHANTLTTKKQRSFNRDSELSDFQEDRKQRNKSSIQVYRRYKPDDQINPKKLEHAIPNAIHDNMDETPTAQRAKKQRYAKQMTFGSSPQFTKQPVANQDLYGQDLNGQDLYG